MVENQFERKIKVFQSDGGGEFRHFKDKTEGSWIIYKFTFPYTSTHNGRIVRKHRQIIEMGLTMLA